MQRILAAASAAALLCAPLLAQPTTPDRLIGLTTGGPVVTPQVSRQQLCQTPSLVCPTGIASPSGHAGGAAYNALNASIWVTQGTRMEERRIADCQLICSTPANLTLGAGSVATGLAICESRFQMLQLESVLGNAAVSVRHIRSCPPQVISVCSFNLPSPRHLAGAVAVDDRNGRVFYATSVFGGLVSPQNTVLVARLDDPCNILCRFTVDSCDATTRLGAIVGAAYDACSGALYFTDGTNTTCMREPSPATTPCSFRSVRCCPTGGLLTWHGLDIEPAHPRTVGSSCIGRNCPNCPNQALVANGDPSVGNPGFSISGENLPAGMIFVLGVSPGRCQVPGLPFSCGRYVLGPRAIFLPASMVGGMRCDGQVLTSLPIPKDYSLCGLSLCAQGFVVCRTPIGNGISVLNALDVTVSG
ncbi:MAG: hypothetical protein AAF628_16770 [Planctomycetota bacterium]